MIETIHIKNFKSIIDDTVKLKGLTVIIGPNGSGKSNLIKALDFLATIPKNGVIAAVNRYGGFAGIVPKAIETKDFRRTQIEFEYVSLLPSPEGYSENLPPINVRHVFRLGYSHKEIVRLISERIDFNQVFAVTAALSEHGDSSEMQRYKMDTHSRFTLKRGPKGGISFEAEPSLSAGNIPIYLEWLGFEFAKELVKSPNSFRQFLLSISSTKKEGIKTTERQKRLRRSFLDRQETTIVDYAKQFQRLHFILSNSRRYDLLLGELRREQDISESITLLPDGRNMPSALGYLASDPDLTTRWNRILSTLGAIAPHIDAMSPASLRTGRQFVEFVEDFANRGVESWESSDGTLRALAILLALESNPEYTTLLIEEPEQNLHPWAIRSVIEHVREAVAENHLQVVITTHSKQVLNTSSPDEVLVATRTKKDGTKFKPLKDLIPSDSIDMEEIGEMWEKGLLGGVPSYD
jgi:predicted ATPase